MTTAIDALIHKLETMVHNRRMRVVHEFPDHMIIEAPRDTTLKALEHYAASVRPLHHYTVSSEARSVHSSPGNPALLRWTLCRVPAVTPEPLDQQTWLCVHAVSNGIDRNRQPGGVTTIYHGRGDKMRQALIDAYLDYRNNYLTVNRYAEYNGLTTKHALRLIELARDVLNSTHPDR
jgi:hypothetical protein